MKVVATPMCMTEHQILVHPLCRMSGSNTESGYLNRPKVDGLPGVVKLSVTRGVGGGRILVLAGAKKKSTP